jgi:hypothetical protein
VVFVQICSGLGSSNLYLPFDEWKKARQDQRGLGASDLRTVLGC